MRKLIFFLSLSAFVFACKDEENDGLSFYYEETQCADPWQKGNYEPATQAHKNAVSAYLSDSLGITFEALEIAKENNEAVCLACTCTNGYVIRLEAGAASEAKLVAFGFVKN
jgi:hypothetical protein